jgi:threonine/homoserine/homoserine lactone efflux protein
MDALLFAFSIGFVSGVSPGPLMTLVLTSTLERGFRAGLLTAVAPLVTDAPVILLSLLVLRQLPETFLAGVTIAGGLFIVGIGIQTVRAAGRPAEARAEEVAGHRDLLRGAIVNLLNPHPWLFWATVGAPLLIATWKEAPWQAVAFLAIFYGLLVGCKVVIAWATARGSRFLGSRWYQRILVGCGLLLVGLGAALIWQVGARL